jgi:hypothetical protein
MNSHVLPQDEGVLVAGVHLDVRIGVVFSGRRAVDPRYVQVHRRRPVGEADLAGHGNSMTFVARHLFWYRRTIFGADLPDLPDLIYQNSCCLTRAQRD